MGSSVWGSVTVAPDTELPVTVHVFEFSEVFVNTASATGVPALTNRFRTPLRCSIHSLSKSIPPPLRRTSPFVAPYTAVVNPATLMSSPMSEEYAVLLPSMNRGAMTLITWSTASQKPQSIRSKSELHIPDTSTEVVPPDSAVFAEMPRAMAFAASPSSIMIPLSDRISSHSMLMIPSRRF